MTPTMELRFVERELADRTIRVLQQKWVHEEGATYTAPEWHDVPVVKETK